MSVSTHVLDAVSGRPAAGVGVVLERSGGGGWAQIAQRRTDADGRVVDLARQLEAGVHRLRFDVEGYYTANGQDSFFYPEVTVTFRVTDPDAHLHVPLLLSPFAYSTYRGS
ncbi:hydroxyisourate hydrolase [uncultured Jatrophihabitans sp.]|uniref:hydroxyisourate hydrolase n=1 Tax=uncultured Jatrophihabitans sp. TaxID=1610747 RepID=UPI0035CAED6E